MLGYREFMEELQAQVARRLGEGYGTSIQQAAKANVGVRDILVILPRKKAEKASLTFSLPPLFREYSEGRGIGDIAGDIAGAYPGQAADVMGLVKNLGNIWEYKRCKHRIYFRLINTGKNRAFLEDKPHFEVLDLSMVFYILAGEDSRGISAVPINNLLLESWGIEAEEAREQAEKNTPGLFPAKALPLSSAIEGLHEKEGEGRHDGEIQAAPESIRRKEAFVITNTKGVNGFSAVLYPEALKDFADSTGKNLYVLPCSLHEAILCPADMPITLQELQGMVKMVNDDAVAEEDILSDSVYYYDRTGNELRIPGKERKCVRL